MLFFEYDPKKSSINKDKHKIDFIEAQELWLDSNRLEIPSSVTTDEPRFLVIGKIGTKHWSAVITYRNDNIRIISVRRSRENEVAAYEGGGIG
ncbi:BrnT family toxin [Scytonema sp. NUACC21]